MHVTLMTHGCLQANGWHNAFTDCITWRGNVYVAYRVARTHGITPPGVIVIQSCAQDVLLATSKHGTLEGVWDEVARLDAPDTDLRDPTFIASEHVLSCMVGAYLPAPWTSGLQALSKDPTENVIVTLVSQTTNGRDWGPWTAILRPGYWGWSTCWHGGQLYLASYHTGGTGETHSISLWGGTHPLNLTPHWTIYDGANLRASQAAHYTPAEPVLFAVDAHTLGCYLRTETGMEVGLSRAPYQDWRWHNTRRTIHPSATVNTPYGRLLAGRDLRGRAGLAHQGSPAYAGLWSMDSQYPRWQTTFPSAGDCAYAGLAPLDIESGLYFTSYYSQHIPTAKGNDAWRMRRGADIWGGVFTVQAGAQR